MHSLLLELTGENFTDWFREHGAAVVVTIVLAFFARWLVRRLVPHMMRPAIERQMAGRPDVEVRRRAETLSGVIVITADAVIFGLARFTILPEFGIDIRPLLAGLGITGLAIGLGAQSLVRDAVNGIFILTENQFARGDVVTIAGVTGTVEDVTLRRTLIRDTDGVVFSVPNSAVIVSANFTRDYAKVRVNVPVHAGSDLAKVRAVVNEVGEALAADPEYSDVVVTAPAFLRIDSIDASGMAVQVNGTVKPGSQWELAGVLRGRLIEAFQREGIKTPWG